MSDGGKGLVIKQQLGAVAIIFCSVAATLSASAYFKVGPFAPPKPPSKEEIATLKCIKENVPNFVREGVNHGGDFYLTQEELFGTPRADGTEPKIKRSRRFYPETSFVYRFDQIGSKVDHDSTGNTFYPDLSEKDQATMRKLISCQAQGQRVAGNNL